MTFLSSLNLGPIREDARKCGRGWQGTYPGGCRRGKGQEGSRSLDVFKGRGSKKEQAAKQAAGDDRRARIKELSDKVKANALAKGGEDAKPSKAAPEKLKAVAAKAKAKTVATPEQKAIRPDFSTPEKFLASMEQSSKQRGRKAYTEDDIPKLNAAVEGGDRTENPDWASYKMLRPKEKNGFLTARGYGYGSEDSFEIANLYSGMQSKSENEELLSWLERRDPHRPIAPSDRETISEQVDKWQKDNKGQKFSNEMAEKEGLNAYKAFVYGSDGSMTQEQFVENFRRELEARSKR